MHERGRMSNAVYDALVRFIAETASAWRSAGMIKNNSFGVEILMAHAPGSDFKVSNFAKFGDDLEGAEHGASWYQENAHGKNLICEATGMDSHEAVRVWQGLVTQIEGAFPWGGAIIDVHYGLIIGTSGFKEDEDILFSRTIRNYLVMLLDREGDGVLNDARQRGEQEGDAGADRFTRIAA